MIDCVYIENWKPDRAQRGRPCGGPIPAGSKVPLCAKHKDLTCAHCDEPATRRYRGVELCRKTRCES